MRPLLTHVPTLVLGGALGVLGSLLFGSGTVPSSEDPPQRPAPHSPSTAPSSGPTPRPSSDEELAALRADVAELRERAALAPVECAARIAAAGGVEPVAWPESESAAEHARVLEEALAQCPSPDGSPLELDCSEYPCAVFGFGDRDALHGCGPLLAAAESLSTGGFSTGSAMTGGVQVNSVFVLPASGLPPELFAAAVERHRIRMTLAAEADADFE